MPDAIPENEAFPGVSDQVAVRDGYCWKVRRRAYGGTPATGRRRERDVPPEEVTYEQRKRMHTALYRNYLLSYSRVWYR